MSMISAQCDELRAMAESIGLEVPQAATLMMEAADAIERLTEQAEDLDFELDKWQTKAEYFKQLADLAEAKADRLRKDAEETALMLGATWEHCSKLRELVQDMYACISHANEQDWFYFERDKFGCGMSCTVNGEVCGLCVFADRMRELGVEVS